MLRAQVPNGLLPDLNLRRVLHKLRFGRRGSCGPGQSEFEVAGALHGQEVARRRILPGTA